MHTANKCKLTTLNNVMHKINKKWKFHTCVKQCYMYKKIFYQPHYSLLRKLKKGVV